MMNIAEEHELLLSQEKANRMYIGRAMGVEGVSTL